MKKLLIVILCIFSLFLSSCTLNIQDGTVEGSTNSGETGNSGDSSGSGSIDKPTDPDNPDGTDKPVNTFVYEGMTLREDPYRGLYVIKYDGGIKDLSIPSVINDKNVVGIETNAFKDNKILTSVAIPSTVYSISDGAFSGCTELKTVLLNEGLFSIGADAFAGCTSIAKIDLPRSLGFCMDAFDGWTEAQQIVVAEYCNINRWTKDWHNDSKAEVVYNNLTADGFFVSYDIFERGILTICGYNGNASDITIPSEYKGQPIERIECFVGDKTLRKINMPSIKEIGAYCFSDCPELSEVVFGPELENIADHAFMNCPKLNDVDVPETVSYIGIKAFLDSPCLEKIPASRFLCWDLTEDGNGVIINYNHGTSETLTVPGVINGKPVKEIKNITTSQLKRLIYDDSLDCVGRMQSDVLEYVDLPANYAIEYGLLSKSPNVSSVRFSEKHMNKLADVLNNSNVKNIILDETVVTAPVIKLPGKYTFTVDPKNKTFYSQGNCLINKVTKTLVRGLDDSVIPSDGSVVRIGEYAFSNCEFDTINIPDTIKYIDSYAFYACRNLSGIEIPNSVEVIDDFGFFSCLKLSEIVIPDTVSVGLSAFANTKVINQIPEIDFIVRSPYGDGVQVDGYSGLKKEVVIPETIAGKKVLSIGRLRMSQYIDNLVLPSTVIHIEDQAFQETHEISKVTIKKGTDCSKLLAGLKLPSCQIVFEELMENPDFQYSVDADRGKIYLVKYKGLAENLVLQASTMHGLPLDTIYVYAFRDLTNLKTLEISEGFVDIKRDAFIDSSLESIVIPASVTDIGADVFLGCTSLKKITVHKKKSECNFDKDWLYRCDVVPEYLPE